MNHDGFRLKDNHGGDSGEKKGFKGLYNARNSTRFMRRQYEGYTMREVLGENGRTVMRSVYTGIWYIQELEPRERRLRRIGFTLLVLLSGALLVFASTRDIIANHRALCAFPEFVCIFGLVWTLYGIFNDCITPPKRTVGDHRSSSLTILRGSLMSAIAGGAACLATLVYTILEGGDTGLNLLAAAAHLASGALAFLVWRWEKNVKYSQEQANPDESEED